MMQLHAIEERINGRKHKEIYDWIRRQDTISKIDLLEHSQMTGSTLTRTLEELTDQGWLLEAGFGESTGGRRPILYQTNPTAGYVFGLDISRMISKLVLCDLHMNKLDSSSWTMDDTMTPELLLDQIAKTASAMLLKHGIAAASVLGMGIGAVGPLDRFSGSFSKRCIFQLKAGRMCRSAAICRRSLDFLSGWIMEPTWLLSGNRGQTVIGIIGICCMSIWVSVFDQP